MLEVMSWLPFSKKHDDVAVVLATQLYCFANGADRSPYDFFHATGRV
jgi:hypothetical protein